MVKNSVLLLLHPLKWYVEEQGRFKTKKYYHRFGVLSAASGYKTCFVMFYQVIILNRHCFLYFQPLLMVRNSVLLLLHPSKWHVEEQGRFKTKKYHRVRSPVWMVAVTGTLMLWSGVESNMWNLLSWLAGNRMEQRYSSVRDWSKGRREGERKGGREGGKVLTHFFLFLKLTIHMKGRRSRDVGKRGHKHVIIRLPFVFIVRTAFLTTLGIISTSGCQEY